MKVMFVCTGNTCRSAMAKYLFEKIIKENNKENIEVYSCGIYAQTGDCATYNAIEVLKKYGIDMTSHRAININESNIKDMDLILCATISHKQIILNMYPDLIGKTYTIKEFAEDNIEGKELDINDPWGYNNDTYLRCAEEIKNSLDKIIEKI